MLPTGIAAADDRLYVTEHHGKRLQVLSTDGEPDHTMPISNFGSLAGVCSIERQGYSQLYAVDSEYHVVHNFVYRGSGDNPPNWYAEIFGSGHKRSHKKGSKSPSGSGGGGSESSSSKRSGSSNQLDAWLGSSKAEGGSFRKSRHTQTKRSAEDSAAAAARKKAL